MRILQLIDSLDAGGAERLAVNLANALVGPVELSCLVVSRKEGILKSFVANEVAYKFLNKKKSIDINATMRLLKFVRKNEIDIIHAHSSSYFLAGTIKLVRPQIKIVWHDHYGDAERAGARSLKIIKPFSRLFSAIISVNQLLQEWAEVNLHTQGITYLRNFTTDPVLDALVNLKIKGVAGKRIVCLANLRPQKNHTFLLHVVREILKDDEEVTLHLLGQDNRDETSKSIHEFVHFNNLKENVFIYGSRADIPDLLAGMDIGVLASLSEGLPISLLEYGMSQLPVVVTDVGACREVVGSSGKVVESNNVDQMTAALKYYLDRPEERRQDAIEFHKRVKELYGQEQYIERLLPIYKATLVRK